MRISVLQRAIAAALLALAASGAPAADCDNPPRLRLSFIPRADARKDAAAFQTLFAALEKDLGRPVEVIFTASYGSVVEGLLAGSIDVAMMGAASYASARNSDPDILAFASMSKKAGAFQEEGPFYRSLLIVRSDSRFDKRESLRGARLALVDPASTSGAVEPRHLFTPLIKLPFEQYFGRVVYSGGHDKSAASVLSKQVDAAFVSGALLSELVSAGKAKAEDYRVLWQSEPIPFSPWVYRGRLCAPIRDKIRGVFLGGNGERFGEALRHFDAVRFAAVSDDNYRMIREIVRAAR